MQNLSVNNIVGQIEMKWIIATAASVALVIFSTLFSIPAGGKLLAYDLRNAQAFCEALVPRLEQAKVDSGAYPPEIARLLDGQRLPKLWRPPVYNSDGTNFALIINDPSTMMGGVVYSSETKDWHHWD